MEDEIKISLIKAFTQNPGEGNPAGVIHNTGQLSNGQMQKIAKKLGFSESAFILPSKKADFRVRFFAVSREVDFCGHATVAAFYSLLEQRIIDISSADFVTVTQETKAGILPVTCYKNGMIMMTQGGAVFGETVKDRNRIANILGISESDFGDSPIQTVSTVIPKLIIPIRSLRLLRRVSPDLAAISEYCRHNTAKGFYLFTTETLSNDSDFSARYFNPLIGIDEDPATGVAAGPLGSYADKYIFAGKKKKIVIEQGFDMGMSSRILVDISGTVKVGGYAVSFGQQKLSLQRL